MTHTQILRHPTVGDMVRWLLLQPQSSPFAIMDVDTGWRVPIIRCGAEAGNIYVTGEYDDATADWPPHTPVTDAPQNYSAIADALEHGTKADIWYDAADHDDTEAAALIDATQEAMLIAAKVLRTMAGSP